MVVISHSLFGRKPFTDLHVSTTDYNSAPEVTSSTPPHNILREPFMPFPKLAWLHVTNKTDSNLYSKAFHNLTLTYLSKPEATLIDLRERERENVNQLPPRHTLTQDQTQNLSGVQDNAPTD